MARNLRSGDDLPAGAVIPTLFDGENRASLLQVVDVDHRSVLQGQDVLLLRARRVSSSQGIALAPRRLLYSIVLLVDLVRHFDLLFLPERHIV
jgi:hypothetical protein